MNAWFTPVPLDGQYLRLDPLTVDDADDYFVALGEPETRNEVLAHMSFHPPQTRDDVVEIIETALADPVRIAYAQRLIDTDEFVGTTSFYEITPATQALAVGHTWLARKRWRTPINTASKLIMLGRAFEGLGAERVVWHTDIRNTRSQTAIERLGATKEGVLRRHRIRPDGSWRDTVQFSMISPEWPSVRQRLETRLAQPSLDGTPPLTAADELTVELDERASRYVARLGDQPAGMVEFSQRGQTMIIVHTGTPPELRGRGIAGQITSHVLDDARARGLRVVPQCPYTADFIDKHPEYADLVAAD